ncbi:MAG TPA: hypothetical protein VHW06_06280 [Streptosporangiaceae bacterium]|jgi:hypothetical protein|nr:hypothetical protein [Streptosporangiaceae bacterium]
MMTDTPQLTGLLLARDQAAQVATDEAKARQAAADADTSALTLAQTKYKSLVPDLTKAATSSVDDKSTGVAFSGLVTYSALNHAAEKVAAQVSEALSAHAASAGSRQCAILVTSQSDLLTNDLLLRAIQSSAAQLSDFAGRVLEATKPDSVKTVQPAEGYSEGSNGKYSVEMFDTLSKGSPAVTAAAAGAAGSLAFGPLGALAAAASAIPSIISMFSSTITAKDHIEDIGDLATSTAVISALSGSTAPGIELVVIHEDFRLAPANSKIGTSCQDLARHHLDLIFRQEAVQIAKNEADLELAQAQQRLDPAKDAVKKNGGTGGEPAADPTLTKQNNEATEKSANAAAALALIATAISSIETFTGAINSTATGQRSPLAVASMTELLGSGDSDGVGYVLSVKGLGGQSEEYTKDRHIGIDTFTTLADASISFMLFDVAARRVIGSGLINGVSSVHGRLGHPPAGLIGPDATTAPNDLRDADPPPGVDSSSDAGSSQQHRSLWRRMF